MSLLTRNPAPARGIGRGEMLPWQSPITIRRRWIVAAFAVSTLFAVLVAACSTDYRHQLWGMTAACGYAVAGLAVMAWRSRGTDLALLISLCGALIVPLAWMASAGHGEPEVTVIQRSAEMLAHHGRPYPPAASLNGTRNPNAYDPYLPALTFFGLLWVVTGHAPGADPRLLFGLAFAAVFGLALRLAGARHPARWTVFATACPFIAMELAVGGTDVPIVALLCLGFALLWRHPRPVLAGLALGAAAAMKETAWPALVIALTLVAMRDGRRAAARCALTALTAVAVVVGPFAALQPSSLVKNTVLFPLGLTSVKSQAVSPLPGHVIAQTGEPGRLMVIAMLVAAAVAVLGSLVFRPPRTVPAAAVRLIVAMIVMFLLAPATRFGYVIYPAGILMWLVLSAAGQRGRREAGPLPGDRGPVLAGPGPEAGPGRAVTESR